MECDDRRPEASSAWRRSKPRRPPLDCRECGAICERLVSPWRCLRSNCLCVYSYKDSETTYFGCLHKVFTPELDLAAFLDAGGEVCRVADPYGPIRATRAPRVHCPVTIERAYPGRSAGLCRNPSFFRGVPPPAAGEDLRSGAPAVEPELDPPR
jgi:hypothetical protein